MPNNFIPKYFKSQFPLKHIPRITKMQWSKISPCLKKKNRPQEIKE